MCFACGVSFWVPTTRGQTLDESWTVTAAGQSIQANPDGSFLVPNIAVPDQFGAGGPGTAPDFLADDFVRLIGFSTAGGTTKYVYSDPFQIRQGEVYRINNLTFTDQPPPIPESIEITAPTQTLTSVGQTVPLSVIGTVVNGATVDVTTRSMWTTYRISNPEIATIDRDGAVTAVSKGKVIVTAMNEGATSTIRIDVSPGDPLTTIEGFIAFEDGVSAPLANIDVSIPTFGRTTTTDANGFFQFTDFPTLIGGAVILTARATVGPDIHIGVVPNLPSGLFSGGITDAGIVRLIANGQDDDMDGIPDPLEPALGYDPTLADSDTPPDGILDGDEDLDGDTLTNADEIRLGLDPLNDDTDADAVFDNDELAHGTSPFSRDTDMDGWSDGIEIDDLSNPLDPLSKPVSVMVSGEKRPIIVSESISAVGDLPRPIIVSEGISAVGDPPVVISAP